MPCSCLLHIGDICHHIPPYVGVLWNLSTKSHLDEYLKTVDAQEVCFLAVVDDNDDGKGLVSGWLFK